MTHSKLATWSIVLGLALAAVAGCKKKNTEGAAGSGSPAAGSAEPAGSGSAAAGSAPAGGADPAKVDQAEQLAARIMIGIAGAVKGAHGDCAEMAKTVTAAMTAAESMRMQLMDAYKDPAVHAAIKAGLDGGKYPDLDKDLNDAQAGATACPDVFEQVDRVVGEIL